MTSLDDPANHVTPNSILERGSLRQLISNYCIGVLKYPCRYSVKMI